MTIYAVGDIHGQFDMLRSVNDLIEADRAREGARDAKVVFVGDYCDRGAQTKEVLDWFCTALKDDAPFVCLAGNHDRMMLGFLDASYDLDPKTVQFDWLAANLGGKDTLKSYGIRPSFFQSLKALKDKFAAVVPQEHLEFLARLRLSYWHKNLFFAHAGVDPEKRLVDQEAQDLLWIRSEFLDSQVDFGAIIVHGHTPAKTVEFYPNRINIDTGAAFGRTLSAVVFEGGDVFQLTQTGRVKINPKTDAG